MPSLVLGRILSNLFVALLLAIAVTGCTDGDNSSNDSQTPVVVTPAVRGQHEETLVGTATPVIPTATAIMGYEGFQILGEFTVAAPIEFPENLMMIVETGCTQCDGPTQALYRVWRNSGETHVDHLVDAGVAGEQESAYIVATVGRPDMGDMLVAICTGGSCGGVVEASPDAQIEFHRSFDGGITWSPFLTQPIGDAAWPVLTTDEGILVAERIADGGEPRYRYVNGREVPSPKNAHWLYAGAWDGEVRWAGADGNELLNEDGSRLAIVEPGSMIMSLAINREWRVPTPLVSWIENPEGRAGKQYVTRMTEDYVQVGYSAEGFIAPQVILASGRVLGNMTKPGAIAGTVGFIDVGSGTLTPIADVFLQPPFGDGQTEAGRNNLLAAVEGPFLRVTSGADCLNIRAEAGAQAQVLTCAADGVVVHDLQTSVLVGADEWRQVRLLDGREGYASADYLSTD